MDYQSPFFCANNIFLAEFFVYRDECMRQNFLSCSLSSRLVTFLRRLWYAVQIVHVTNEPVFLSRRMLWFTVTSLKIARKCESLQGSAGQTNHRQLKDHPCIPPKLAWFADMAELWPAHLGVYHQHVLRKAKAKPWPHSSFGLIFSPEDNSLYIF